jgi:ribosomal protein S21
MIIPNGRRRRFSDKPFEKNKNKMQKYRRRRPFGMFQELSM